MWGFLIGACPILSDGRSKSPKSIPPSAVCREESKAMRSPTQLLIVGGRAQEARFCAAAAATSHPGFVSCDLLRGSQQLARERRCTGVVLAHSSWVYPRLHPRRTTDQLTRLVRWLNVWHSIPCPYWSVHFVIVIASRAMSNINNSGSSRV